MICLISFSKFSDVLSAFTCARAIVNLSNICLRVYIFIFVYELLTVRDLTVGHLSMQATQSKILIGPFPCFSFGNIPLPKAFRTSGLPLRSIIALLRVSVFFRFLTDSFSFVGSLKISVSSLIFLVVQVHHLVTNNCYKLLFQKILWL